MGYKNSKAMHRGIIISSVVLTVVMLGMHLTGALGRAVMPGIEQVDRVIPEMALRLLSPVLAGIFLAGPLAAIMSSVDSQLILASAAIVKDLYINHIAGESGSLDEGKSSD
jgi:Na+/panthothenate symporter